MLIIKYLQYLRFLSQVRALDAVFLWIGSMWWRWGSKTRSNAGFQLQSDTGLDDKQRPSPVYFPFSPEFILKSYYLMFFTDLLPGLFSWLFGKGTKRKGNNHPCSYLCRVLGGAGANPSWPWAQVVAHPGQVASWSQGWHLDWQLCILNHSHT